jgi:hypothetical protein
LVIKQGKTPLFTTKENFMKRILVLGAFVVAFTVACNGPNRSTDSSSGTSADSANMGTGTGTGTDTTGGGTGTGTGSGTDTTHHDSLTVRP